MSMAEGRVEGRMSMVKYCWRTCFFPQKVAVGVDSFRRLGASKGIIGSAWGNRLTIRTVTEKTLE